MTELFKQMSSTVGAAFAAACCFGAAWALSVLSAIGAGFLYHDAVLIPAYVALLGLSVWLLARSARAHEYRAPLWLGVAGALMAAAGMWTSVVLVVAGIAALVAANVWDYLGARRRVRHA